MVKRKTTGSPELRTVPLPLTLARLPTLKAEPWNLGSLQPYFSPLACLFKTESLEHVHEQGVRLDESIQAVLDSSTIRTSNGRVVPVHRKVTMLLNPYSWMKGEFGTVGFPNPRASEVQGKLQSPHNAAQVGSILSIALSQSGCDHFPKVQGAQVGICGKHTINLSDDQKLLSERPWFTKNIGKTFELTLNQPASSSPVIQQTRKARIPLELGDDIMLDDIAELEGIPTETTEAAVMTKLFQEESIAEEHSDDSSDASTSYVFHIESVGTIDTEVEEFFEEEEEEEDFAWATFKDVPVQVTVMEQCEGLLQELLKAHPDPVKHHAWISQILFALAFAQRNFAFTHNDLHGNNVMYNSTTHETLQYTVGGIHYAVPTQGYMLKIIDFDRGIGTIRLPGMKEGKVFMSDQFAADDEAGGQQNCEPFYLSKYPTIKPNPSFDLVRFATSLFWDLFPAGPNHEEQKSNLVFQWFVKWMTLEDGSSVMFHPKNPKVDRYPGFHIQKAIARYCKDTAVPRKEIESLVQFQIDSIPAGIVPLLIDA